MRQSTLVFLAAVVFALPTGAQAKGNLTRLPVCGASGCKTVTDATTIEGLLTFGEYPHAAPPSASFYTLTPHWSDQWPPTWPRYVYVPAAEAVGMAWATGRVEWFRVELPQTFHDVARGLEPFPAMRSWKRAVTMTSPTSQTNGHSRELLIAISLAVVISALIGVWLRARAVTRAERRSR
jgi:hypothetical protein